MKIVFDCDGVIRDLLGYLHTVHKVPLAEEWFWTYWGKDIYEWAKEDDYKILTAAPPTEYLPIAVKFAKEIWTSQPPVWQAKTIIWCDKHLPGVKIRFLTNAEKRERLDFLTDTILIEDSPEFDNYRRIILVDTLYNKGKGYFRVAGAEELGQLCQNILSLE